MVTLAIVLLYASTYFESGYKQIAVFIAFSLIDTSLWTLEAPKSAYLLEVFDEKEQLVMLNGNVLFAGAGGVLGFLITTYFGKSTNK